MAANGAIRGRESRGGRSTLSRIIRGALITWLAMAALAGATGAEPFGDAETAYRRGDYATARWLLRPLADQGHAAAQAGLGVMYGLGQGVPRDYAEAVRWYRKAADQGHAEAQSNLAFMYESGQGVPQDYVEAVRWFRTAADQGDQRSMLFIVEVEGHGSNVPARNLFGTYFDSVRTQPHLFH